MAATLYFNNSEFQADAGENNLAIIDGLPENQKTNQKPHQDLKVDENHNQLSEGSLLESIAGKQVTPKEGKLIEDSFFHDIGFVSALEIRGVSGFLPVPVNNEATVEDYGFVTGDIIVEINGISVSEELSDFLDHLEKLRSTPKTFFDEVIVFTVNRNNVYLELEIAID